MAEVTQAQKSYINQIVSKFFRKTQPVPTSQTRMLSEINGRVQEADSEDTISWSDDDIYASSSSEDSDVYSGETHVNTIQ